MRKAQRNLGCQILDENLPYRSPLDAQQKLMRHAQLSTTMEYGDTPMENTRKANSKVVKIVVERKSSLQMSA